MSTCIVVAGGLLSGCVFADEEELTNCHLCDQQFVLRDLEQHMSSHPDVKDKDEQEMVRVCYFGKVRHSLDNEKYWCW